MDHIFGDSHDIDFGGPTPPVSQAQGNAHTSISKKNSNVPPARPHRPMQRGDSIGEKPIVVSSEPMLTRMLASMKPSFFPRHDDAVFRMVALSHSQSKDPLFIFRQDDTTILVGSGFSSIERAGKVYPTFPDMRLALSEKDRIRAWVMMDNSIDVSRFECILPTLGFPPIYATRDVIANFRNEIKNSEFLDSCRFFEIFSDGSTVRRIGDIELYIADGGTQNMLGIMASGVRIGFDVFPLTGGDLGGPHEHRVGKNLTEFSLNDTVLHPGEIISFQRDSEPSRHSMKFTFDTFFLDEGSLGIVAGYTLSDREQLSTNGVLIFTLEHDSRLKTIMGHIFIDSRGFVHAYEMMSIHKEILKGIRSTYEKMLLENPKIERGELVQGLRREVTKYCYLLTGRTPVVMPVLIER